MKNNDFENKLKKYFKLQENSAELPEESSLTAFYITRDQVTDTAKRRIRIKPIAVIAACMAAIISIVATVAVFERMRPDETESDMPSRPKYLGEPVEVEGMADWYEPGELSIEATILNFASNSSLSASSSGLIPLSYNAPSTTKEVVFPDFVSDVYAINENYLRIYIGNYYDVPDEYKYIIGKCYDLRTGEYVNLLKKIHEVTNNCLKEDGIKFEVITRYTISDWCILKTMNTKAVINGFYKTGAYAVNMETGEYHWLPYSHEKLYAISEDYTKFIFHKDYSEKIDGELRLVKRESILYDVTTRKETVFYTAYKGETLTTTQASFSPDGRYAIAYLYASDTSITGDYSGPMYQPWVIYDTETGVVQKGKGEIIRYTEKNDACIVRDPDGVKIYRLSDMKDVTNKYILKAYEKYELTTERQGDTYSLFLKPLFEETEPVLITDDIVYRHRWGDYQYIFRKDAEEMLVYSIKENEYFTCPLPFDKNLMKTHSVSIIIGDSGKCCYVTITQKRNKPI